MHAHGLRREDFQTLAQRLLRVARLDVSAFLEVRDDPVATLPALVVVVASSLLAGLGGWLFYLADHTSNPYLAGQPFDSGGFFVRSVLTGSLFAILLWFGWVIVTTAMLERVWKRRVQFVRLTRTMGLAYFPIGLSLFMFIPGLATPIGVSALAAAVLLSGVAVEASTDAEPAEVLFANLAGFALFAIVLGLAGRDLRWYAPGIFAFSL